MFPIPKDLPQFETGQALIILDLQTDFLSPEGKLPLKNGIRFVQNIKDVVPAFREKGLVVWVRTEFEGSRLANDARGKGEAIVTDEQLEDESEEGDLPSAGPSKSTTRETPRAGTHKSTSPEELDEAFLSVSASGQEPQCCLPGSSGAEIMGCMSSVVDPAEDSTVTKSYYSAFKNTSLLSTLRSRIVTDLYICGSLSNISVYATALDAARHGFSITILEDCLGYRSEARHNEAMRQMTELMGADSMNSGELRRTLKTVKTEKNLEMGSLASVGSTSGGDILQLLKGMRLNGGPDDADPAGNAVVTKGIKPQDEKIALPKDVDWERPPNIAYSSQSSTAASCKVRTRTRVRKRESSEKTKSRGDAIAEGDCQLVHDFLPSSMAQEVFQKLQSEVKWQTMHHRGGEVPRLVAVQGDIGEDGSVPIYRHPADESPLLQPFSPTVSAIREEVQKLVKHPVNHVLIQCYRSGEDNISEHSDKTLDIVRGSSIVNVSLGAQRTMTLRTKKALPTSKGSPSSHRGEGRDNSAREILREASEEGEPRKAQRVTLPHNSIFTLGPLTNTRWLHAIRPDRRPPVAKAPAEIAFDTQRISLTFRHIGTFMDPKTRAIWGQGAKGKSKEGAGKVRDVISDEGDDRAKDEEQEKEKEEEAMVRAFGIENHDVHFDWDAVYGRGFDVLGVPPPHPPGEAA
ncbi:MAG: hypothetical protein M1819_007299 [Sarea resinae]|nr:MAG: hypothetical protein M1819_007299 [Sarea resinae]